MLFCWPSWQSTLCVGISILLNTWKLHCNNKHAQSAKDRQTVRDTWPASLLKKRQRSIFLISTISLMFSSVSPLVPRGSSAVLGSLAVVLKKTGWSAEIIGSFNILFSPLLAVGFFGILLGKPVPLPCPLFLPQTCHFQSRPTMWVWQQPLLRDTLIPCVRLLGPPVEPFPCLPLPSPLPCPALPPTLGSGEMGWGKQGYGGFENCWVLWGLALPWRSSLSLLAAAQLTPCRKSVLCEGQSAAGEHRECGSHVFSLCLD